MYLIPILYYYFYISSLEILGVTYNLKVSIYCTSIKLRTYDRRNNNCFLISCKF